MIFVIFALVLALCQPDDTHQNNETIPGTSFYSFLASTISYLFPSPSNSSSPEPDAIPVSEQVPAKPSFFDHIYSLFTTSENKPETEPDKEPSISELKDLIDTNRAYIKKLDQKSKILLHNYIHNKQFEHMKKYGTNLGPDQPENAPGKVIRNVFHPLWGYDIVGEENGSWYMWNHGVIGTMKSLDTRWSVVTFLVGYLIYLGITTRFPMFRWFDALKSVYYRKDEVEFRKFLQDNEISFHDL